MSSEKDPAKFWKNFGKKQDSAVEDFVGRKKAMGRPLRKRWQLGIRLK
jgi:hypothetical protein